jgi:hypothetical protein
MKFSEHTEAPTPALSLEAIQLRAYELYEEGGHRGGHEIEDWLRAEQELREQPPSRKERVRGVARRGEGGEG